MVSDDPLVDEIKQYQDRHDIGLRELSRHADLSAETMSRLLDGFANVRRSTLVKLRRNLALDAKNMLKDLKPQDLNQ